LNWRSKLHNLLAHRPVSQRPVRDAFCRRKPKNQCGQRRVSGRRL